MKRVFVYALGLFLAFDKNSENCLFLLKEPDNIQVYQERFEELWKANSQDKSEQWFVKQKIINMFHGQFV